MSVELRATAGITLATTTAANAQTCAHSPGLGTVRLDTLVLDKLVPVTRVLHVMLPDMMVRGKSAPGPGCRFSCCALRYVHALIAGPLGR
jgi:hypothetical protein